MTLDSEKQKQDLLSLLAIVPFQGNISQGIDKFVMEVKQLMSEVQMAKVGESNADGSLGRNKQV